MQYKDPDVKQVYYNKKNKCIICNENLLKLRKDGTPYSLKCILCTNIIQNEKLKLKKRKDTFNTFFDKTCTYCEKNFTTEYRSQKYCNEQCKEQEKNRLYNLKGCKERKPVDLKTATKLSRQHAYVKEPEYLKKFKAVRG